jgi:hypothetical protein
VGEGLTPVFARLHVEQLPGVGNALLLHVPTGHGGAGAGSAVEAEGHGKPVLAGLLRFLDLVLKRDFSAPKRQKMYQKCTSVAQN